MEQYADVQQLMKKEDGQKDRKPVYPPTVIQAVFDAKTGASLEAILAQFNSIYVQYQGTPKDTRLIIPMEMRRAGLTITYMDMDSNTITERANSAVQKDNDHWGLDVNWSRVDELSLSGDISVSSKGTWIINGKDTGVKALGPKGDAGLTPWLKTIDNKLHFSYDNVTWDPCSENIAAWFRWIDNKIQISRDNKTWTDLSGKFADNVHIKGYVANYASLPSGAVQGDIYGVGPTYAAEDTAHTNPIYRYYVRNANTWVDNGSFTSLSAGVVQETGESETEVMSQKAVTEKFTELGSEVSKIFSEIGSFNNTWKQGTIENGDNEGWPAGSLNNAVTNRITSESKNIKPGTIIEYSVPEDYYLSIRTWDGISTIISDSSGWLSGIGTFTLKNSNVYFTVSKKDKTVNINPNEGENISIIYFNTIVKRVSEIEDNISLIINEPVINWFQGTIEDGSNPGWPVGTITNMSTRICAKVSNLVIGTPIYYSIPDNYYLAISDWDGTSELITNKSGWLSGKGEFVLNNSNVFLIVSKGDRNQNIYPQEGKKIKIVNVNVNVVTDVNKWNKKIFVSYGDSITQLNLWQPHIVNELKLNHINLGIGGTRVAKIDAKGNIYENSYSEDERINNIPEDTDLITIMGGANDFGSPYPSLIGDIEYDRAAGGYKTDNFVSALCETIRKIQLRCRKAVICVLPWIGGQYTNANFLRHEVTVNNKPTENGVLYITINGVKHEINYTKEQSIESLVNAISSVKQNLIETSTIGNVVGFSDNNGIETWNFNMEGGDSFLTYKTMYSLPLRYNYIGNTPLDFRNAAKMAADYMNVYYIDIWNCGFNAVNRELYFSDTVHPNALGGERIARFLIGELKKIQPL